MPHSYVRFHTCRAETSSLVCGVSQTTLPAAMDAAWTSGLGDTHGSLDPLPAGVNSKSAG